MDNKERSLLVSELMRFEEMMDERIPIPDFTSTSSLIESFEKSLELLSNVDQLCNKSFNDLPNKLSNLEKECMRLQSEIIEDEERSQQSSIKLDKLLAKLPSDYKEKSLSELLYILKQLQEDLNEAEVNLKNKSEDDRIETIINKQYQQY